MKTSRNATTKQNKQGLSKKPRPEIRDDMDSRQRKEKSAKRGAAAGKKPLKTTAKKKK